MIVQTLTPSIKPRRFSLFRSQPMQPTLIGYCFQTL